jgi:hypothetical protein
MTADTQEYKNEFTLEGAPSFLPRKPKALKKWALQQRIKRERTIICHVRDVHGVNWDVRQIRATKHAFYLFFGSPSDDPCCGLSRLIATRELRDFWDSNRTRHDGFLYDLPAGRSTLKRVRRRLQFNFRHDWARFWTDRLDDLKTISARDFAAKHGVEQLVVFDMRNKILGRRARQLGWWREPWIVETLLAKGTLRAAAEKLGIGTSHVKRLRDRALSEVQCELRPAA